MCSRCCDLLISFNRIDLTIHWLSITVGSSYWLQSVFLFLVLILRLFSLVFESLGNWINVTSFDKMISAPMFLKNEVSKEASSFPCMQKQSSAPPSSSSRKKQTMLLRNAPRLHNASVSLLTGEKTRPLLTCSLSDPWKIKVIPYRSKQSHNFWDLQWNVFRTLEKLAFVVSDVTSSFAIVLLAQFCRLSIVLS